MKTAILIADIDDDIFHKFKVAMYNEAWDEFRDHGTSVFYIKGRSQSKWQSKYSNFHEKLRYSPFWILQYCIDSIQLFQFKFRRPATSMQGDTIFVDIPDQLRYLTVKMTAGFEMLGKLGYEFVYRTTLSSVINRKELERVTFDSNKDAPLYAGYLVDFNEHAFISGASTLLNSEALKILGERRKYLNFAKLDDVAIGRIFEGYVEPKSIRHGNLESCEDVEALNSNQILETLSFRCKTSTEPRTDVLVMSAILKRLKFFTNGDRNFNE